MGQKGDYMPKIITVKQVGDFSATRRFFERAKEIGHLSVYDSFGKRGVDALSSCTPKRTGKTASSWSYEIQHDGEDVTITWLNTNVNKGVNIAIILQYGHGTRNGGYVAGRDYINPAIQPIMDQIANDVWAEVTK